MNVKNNNISKDPSAIFGKKMELKGHWFDSIYAVQAVTTKAFNSIPETDFQRAFNKWQMRRTKYIDAGGMYFED